MASLARLGRSIGRKPLPFSSLLLNRVPLVTSAVRNAWNKDWTPNPYPKTEKERNAAAKKYGLRSEDYQPYPDDGWGHGDYPMFDPVGDASKSPWEAYDIPELKRNFGEVMHFEQDIIREAYWNPTQKYRYSWAYMNMAFFGIMGTFIFFYAITLPYPHVMPVMPKQFPRDGKHYIFEPVEE